MDRFPHPAPSRQRLRIVGRMCLALVAGGAFAALSWDPAPAPEDTVKPGKEPEDLFTAEWRSIVTEDDASPHLAYPSAAPLKEDHQALSQARTKVTPWLDRNEKAAGASEATSREDVPSDQTEEVITITTAVQNPRAPP